MSFFSTMTTKTSNTHKQKLRVGDYGSISVKNSDEMVDEESQELLRISHQQPGGQSSLLQSAKAAAAAQGGSAEHVTDQQSYGTSFQLDETSSTHVSSLLGTKNGTTTANNTGSSSSLRNIAMSLSLYVNLAILAGKAYVYIKTLSLAVLAALLDSLLDVVSQLVLYYTERTSDLRYSEIYPAGAARLASFILFFKS
jgi:hypothetical protein